VGLFHAVRQQPGGNRQPDDGETRHAPQPAVTHRSRRLWIALDPGAEIQVGDEFFYPQPGQEFWIPANTRHRLSSTGPEVRVLEVAFGNWQQADITRYADDFQRSEQGE
jgi:mannose-6-phosphate isomerase-like protein (cupin superfamily)